MKILVRLFVLALITPGVLLVLLFIFFFIFNAYDRHTLNQRMQYWTEEMQQALPHGTSIAAAQEFFLARGISISCSAEPDGFESCAGREDEEYGVLPAWHLRFSLKFKDGALVSAERTALGIGL